MPTKLVLTALALTLLLVQDVAHALVTVKKQQLVSDGAGQQGAPMRKQPLHPSAQALLKQGLLDRRTYALHQPLDRVNVHNVRSTEEPRIQFRVDRNTLRESGQWFEVSWQGVEAPAISDWIALWVPATANHSQTAPSKWRLAAECLSHLSTGAGRLRCDIVHADVLDPPFPATSRQAPSIVFLPAYSCGKCTGCTPLTARGRSPPCLFVFHVLGRPGRRAATTTNHVSMTLQCFCPQPPAGLSSSTIANLCALPSCGVALTRP